MASDEPIAQPTEISTQQKPRRVSDEEFDRLAKEPGATFQIRHRGHVLIDSAEGPVSDEELNRRVTESLGLSK